MNAAVAEGLTLEEAEAQAAQFAGHSLRAGLATSAAANEAPGHAIQRQLRHARFDTTTRYSGQATCSKTTRRGWRACKQTAEKPIHSEVDLPPGLRCVLSQVTDRYCSRWRSAGIGRW